MTLSRADMAVAPEQTSQSASARPAGFLVVGVGASAGGLEAFTALLEKIPRDVAMAFVFLQHLDPLHRSELAEILGGRSQIPIQWVNGATRLAPGRGYVLPPGHGLAVKHGTLVPQPTPAEHQPHLIDHFFRSLALDARQRGVGVVLSGSGTDGALGLKAIKSAGGLTFAQEEASAAVPAMPAAAVASGFVDRVLPAARIAEELVKLSQQNPEVWEDEGSDAEPPAPADADNLSAIFRLLDARTGVDFTEYKQSTIKRRLLRRMALTKSEPLAEYVKLLQRSREEVQALYESLLINVTEFFRDPECFDFIRKDILPRIIAHHEDNSPIRVWVPGCSTGEEAYSISILIRELLEDSGRLLPVQVFCTDISDRAVTTARAGLYSAAEVANISPERLRRFFFKTERGYVVHKPIRDMCVFARQNVTKDSPFSRLDLITCRNLLIYLGPALQRKLIPIFHYALNPIGHLVLGSSESVGPHADLFRLVDRRFRIYSRKSSSRRVAFDFSIHSASAEPTLPPKTRTSMPDDRSSHFDLTREADRVVLSRHGPPGILVNDDLEILQFRGNVGAYLGPLPGRASLSVAKMSSEALAQELQNAVAEAKNKAGPVQREGITIFHGGSPHKVDLDVAPIDDVHTKERFYLILFIPSEATGEPTKGPPKPKGVHNTHAAQLESQIEQLKHDLEATRNYLQSTIEKHEVTNQELRAASEEIQSSNEELQSTNEELETAKEELQSTNEELTTVNEELHNRQLELLQANNDLTNLINSVQLPIIILGQDMRIRRFTPMTEKVLNIIPSDVGRPLSDLNLNLSVTDLPRLIAEVMESLTVRELEVQGLRDRWYWMRLRPYKTTENKIEGVVMTLIDVDQMKQTISELQETRNVTHVIAETIDDPFVVLNAQFRVKVANSGYYRLVATTWEETEDRSFFDIAGRRWNIPAVRAALERVLSHAAEPVDLPVTVDLPTGKSTVHLRARQVPGAAKGSSLILVTIAPEATQA